MTLTVRAILGEAARNGLEQTGAPMSAGSRVEASIEFSWATVFLCMPELCWERAPIVRNETTKTTAVEPGLDDPRSLLGLKIDGLTANAYIPGRFTKALPFVSAGPARNEALVSLGIMPSIILFSVPWRVERLSNGFYRSRLSEWQLELSQVGWEWLERVLRQDDQAEMTLQGVGIGHLDNLSEFGYSATDNRGSLRQPIETFTIKAELTDDGIDISVTGSLGDIDPRTAGDFAPHLRPRPVEHFEISARYPYALVALRWQRLLPYRILKRTGSWPAPG